jgi:hypothetical protein
MNYTLQFSPLKTPLEKALVFAKKGVSLDSQNQHGAGCHGLPSFPLR